MIQTVALPGKLFEPKVKTIGKLSDFFSERRQVERAAKSAIVMLGTAAMIHVLTPEKTYAMDITSKIIDAFQPIISLIQGISYPVAFIMLCSGFLVIMTGNRHKGLAIIKWSAIGYLGMQFAPAIMSMLVEVGKAMVK